MALRLRNGENPGPLPVLEFIARANFGLPQNSIFNTNGTIRSDAGRITSTATSSRQMQLGVRFVF